MASYSTPIVSPSGRVLKERTIVGLHEVLLAKVRDLPGLSADSPILDIGCGTGAWLERLAAGGFRILHGVDKDVSQFGSSRATCSEVDLDAAADLGLGNRKFDLITAVELVEHLVNPGKLFFHVCRHLSEEGVFLMTTPNIHSVLCRFRFLVTGNLKHFDSKADPTHLFPVLVKSLHKILPRYSLAIADKWPYPADGGSLTSRPMVKALARALGLFLPNGDPGDVLCLMIRKERSHVS